MELLRLMGLCLACLPAVVLLKKNAPEQALLLTAAILSLALLRCLSLAAPLLETLGSLFERAGIESAHVGVLAKTAATAAVTRLASDLCKDGGSQAMASAVELAGAVVSLVIALPLVEAVAELLLGFFA